MTRLRCGECRFPPLQCGAQLRCSLSLAPAAALLRLLLPASSLHLLLQEKEEERDAGSGAAARWRDRRRGERERGEQRTRAPGWSPLEASRAPCLSTTIGAESSHTLPSAHRTLDASWGLCCPDYPSPMLLTIRHSAWSSSLGVEPMPECFYCAL